MNGSERVVLVRWGAGDEPVLHRANTPEMTTHLGGPETHEQVHARHEKYLRLSREGTAEMYRIDLDGRAVGGIGFWQADEQGTPAWEVGWSVEPGAQGRGVATTALRMLLARIAERRARDLVVAYPGLENAASNALCARVGFTPGRTMTGPWRGGTLTSRVWTLDICALSASRRADPPPQTPSSLPQSAASGADIGTDCGNQADWVQ